VNGTALLLAFGVLVGGSVRRDELILPQAPDRNGPTEVAYHFDSPMTGRGFLDIEWSDVVGRTVERRRVRLEVTDASQVILTLDTRRAVTIKNQLVAHLSVDVSDQSGHDIHREN